MDIPEHVQQRATTMMRDVEHLAHEEKLRGLELLILEGGRLRGSYINLYKYFRRDSKEVTVNRTRHSRHD